MSLIGECLIIANLQRQFLQHYSFQFIKSDSVNLSKDVLKRESLNWLRAVVFLKVHSIYFEF